MTHLNRAVAGLADGGPIFYTGGHTGAELTFEAGRTAAVTWADYINVGMEHGTFDLAGLDRFMQGLAAAHRESGTGRCPPSSSSCRWRAPPRRSCAPTPGRCGNCWPAACTA